MVPCSQPSFDSVGLSRTVSNKGDPRDEFHPKGKSLRMLVAASGADLQPIERRNGEPLDLLGEKTGAEMLPDRLMHDLGDFHHPALHAIQRSRDRDGEDPLRKNDWQRHTAEVYAVIGG